MYTRTHVNITTIDAYYRPTSYCPPPAGTSPYLCITGRLTGKLQYFLHERCPQA